MNVTRRAGFTLIELLTVIAIIAILAAMTMVIAPRIIERAKIRRMASAMRQIDISLTAYSVDHSTYPPAYGYVSLGAKNDYNPPTNPALEERFYNLQPYLAALKEHGTEAYNDEFSVNYDTDGDGRLSLLEFLPHGVKQPTGEWKLDKGLPRYNGSNNAEEVARQMKDKRPFIYIPVNKAQFQRVQKAWINGGDFLATTWPPASDPSLANMQFPPPKYDGFVLIGVGPGGGTFGLLEPPRGADTNPRDVYHINALRAYFLATRDLNANGQLDFDFTARTQQKEGTMEYTVNNRPCNNDLPWAMAPKGAGPYIFKSQ